MARHGGCMHVLILVACVGLIQANEESLNRDEIRKSILEFRQRRNADQYSEEVGEYINNRVKRQVTSFPSDDEDFEESSGDGGESSGEDEPLPPDAETNVVEPPLTPVDPTTPPLVEVEVYNWVWYRSTVNFQQSIVYKEELKDHYSEYFHQVADEIMTAVEFSFTHTLKGIPEVTPLMFTHRENGDVFVLIDVGTCSYNTEEETRQAMYDVVASGSIGDYQVSTESFGFRKIGIDPGRNECGTSGELLFDEDNIITDERETTALPTTRPTSQSPTTPVPPKSTTRKIPSVCGEQEATCRNGQCIARTQICDGTQDCFDGSDERSCKDDSSRCDPTEFLCPSGACVMKLYRCDGDDDCGDGFDEKYCVANANVNGACQGNEFECKINRQCIPYSYYCDGEEDCSDGSDEDGCSKPIVTKPPKRNNTVREGETVVLDCTAEGKPAPIISWRLNWGNVAPPPRVTMESSGGKGTLTIQNVKKSDQGAYTCEAINPNGSIFAIPDAVVIVQDGDDIGGDEPLPPDADEDACPAGSYMVMGGYEKFVSYLRQPNSGDSAGDTGASPGRGDGSSGTGSRGDSAGEPGVTDQGRPERISTGGSNLEDSTPDNVVLPDGYFTNNYVDLCVPCYCYGVTDECMVTEKEYGQIGVDFDTPVNMGRVELRPAKSEGAVPTASEPINANQIVVNPASRELQLIDLSKRFLAAAHYWSLPAEFLGSKINSYGGTLTFTFSYNNSYNFPSKPTNHSDVILEGKNGKTLVFHDKDSHPEPVKKHEQTVDFVESAFKSPDGSETSHEDFLQVLSNIDKILIRTVYDNSMLSTGIGDVKLSVALPSSSTSAKLDVGGGANPMFVEECKCPPGYAGSSCEECAPGYVRVHGGSEHGKCQLEDVEPTIPTEPGKGTETEVRCKAGTEGENCSECKSGYFFYHDDNPEGCIACYCSGVTDQCESSLWYIEELEPAYSSAQHFILTNARADRNYQDSIQLTSQSRTPMITAHLDQLRRDIYYWQLPHIFTGNHVTSYGGKLRYTITYQQLQDGLPITRIADVKLIGSNLQLEYRSNVHVAPNTHTPFEVVLREDNFVHYDGRQATRQEIMTVLKDVQNIIIRASYSSSMGRSIIYDISMETAGPQNNGNEIAMAVERCICPPGYTGVSCEKCAPGYHSTSDGTCQRCNCNGHSDICDPDTGACLRCQDNTFGPNCDRCIEGFYGNPTFGTTVDCRPCPCPMLPATNLTQVASCSTGSAGQPICDICPDGYEGDRCERCASGFKFDVSSECRKEDDSCSCDANGSLDGTCDANGQCNCKPSTEGKQCDACKPSYFYFSVENVNGGCLPCFCMGVTRKCKSSSYSRSKIDADLTVGENGGFALVNRLRTMSTTDGVNVQGGREVVRSQMDDMPSGTYYWQLPDDFKGDKVVSYGGELSYVISHISRTSGAQPITDSDVILIGNDIMLLAKGGEEVPERERVTKKIVFREQYWTRADGTPANREHLLMALADVEDILIRATYTNAPYESRIGDVSMETASEEDFDGEPAVEVEECICPDGYEGLSCEDCAPGFTRSGGGLYLGLCSPCKCNGHADVCDSESGVCVDCRDHTTGDNCEECVSGYYGLYHQNELQYCRACACPGTGDDSFSDSCEYNSSTGVLRCTACQEGYQGDRCEDCAPGYEGNPRSPGGRCTKTKDPSPVGRPPVVTVSPKQLDIEVGRSGRLSCQVQSDSSHRILWQYNGSNRLPSSARASLSGDSLTFRNFQKNDAGTYTCLATNIVGTTSDDAVIAVAENTPMIKVKVEEPRVQRVRVGSDVTFVCTATSKMSAFIISWGKQGARLPRGRSTDFKGILHIRNVQIEDSGTLVCTGSNMYDIDQETATLVVFQDGPVNTGSKPTVTVTPNQQTAKEGDTVVFKCSANGVPRPTIEWRPSPGEKMPDSAVVIDGDLHIAAVDLSDTALYYCRASNENGIEEATALLDVQIDGQPPVVRILTATTENKYVGETVEMRCTATGIPIPQISWRRIGENSLPHNAQAIGGRLIIRQLIADDQGTYGCQARNQFGRDEAFVRLIISLPTTTTIAPSTTDKSSSQKPICTTDPAEITIYTGARVSVPCHVDGDPLPTVTWERNEGEPLDSNAKVEGNKLVIENVTLANSGEYFCVATNTHGTTKSVLTINVDDKQLPEVEILPRNRLEVEAGDSAYFTCNPTNGDDIQITWMRAGEKPFTANTRIEGNTIRFRNISPAEMGSYICLSKNVVGYRESAAMITVKMRPRITVSPGQNVDAFEGDSLELRCTADGYPEPNVAWKNEYPLTAYKKISNSYTIDSVKLGTTEYTCIAYGSEMATMTVRVTGKTTNTKPIISLEPNRAVIEGNDVTIRCTATGHPTPHIKWQNMPEGATTSNGVLTIRNFKPSDAGTYLCLAANNRGYSSESVTITLIEPPTVMTSQSSVSIVEGGTKEIMCSVTSGTAPVVVEWTKQSGTLSNHISASDGSLLFTSYDPLVDAGTYVCSGTNDAGSSTATVEVYTSGPPTVSVDESEVTINAGEAITLSCRTDGDSTWIKQDGEIDQSRSSIVDGTLMIQNANAADMGTYICEATNSAGTSSASTNVIVYEAPSIEIVTNPVSGDPLIIKEGSQVSIKCVATGNPTPTVALMKNDFEVLEFSGAELMFDSIRVDDSGSYACMATSVVGVAKALKAVFVEANTSPLKLTATPESGLVDVQSGEEIVISCSTDHPSTITWTKLNGKVSENAIKTSGQLTIFKAGVADSGQYVCTATSNGQTVEQMNNVTVRAFIPFFTQTPKSYMSVKLLPDELSTGFRITLSFRPIANNGYILYGYSGGGDYVSLRMVEGKLEYRFDVGSGAARITNTNVLPLSEWSTVTISRRGRDGQMRVNDEDVVSGTSLGPFSALNLADVVHIGGFPISAIFPSDLKDASASGFYGCISQVIINDNNIELGSSERITDTMGVSGITCKTCSGTTDTDNPCQNNAQCTESHNAVTGYTCHCLDGFVGPQCQFRKEDICGDPDACSFHGSCQPDYNRVLGYRCECYEGYVGAKCGSKELDLLVEKPDSTDETEYFDFLDVTEQPQNVISEEDVNYTPGFTRDSYIELPALSVQELGTRNLDLEVELKPMSLEDGLLLYGESVNSRRRRRNADKSTMLLVIKNGSLVLTYSCGSDPVTISANAASLNVATWHKIKIQRLKRKMTLEIDDVPYTFDHSETFTCKSGTAGNLYIGGINYWNNIPSELASEGFTGCAKKLRLNGAYVNLRNTVKSKNIVQCETIQYTTTPVITTTTTIATTTTTTTLEPIAPLFLQAPVSGTNAKFGGKSYAKFNEDTFKHTNSSDSAEQFSISFRTTATDGLILLHAQVNRLELQRVPQVVQGKRYNFIAGIRRSHFEYYFKLGSAEGVLKSEYPVSDGIWHKVTVLRRGTIALMFMDDSFMPVAQQAAGRLIDFSGELGPLYIGGSPTVKRLTNGRYSKGFNGCLKDIRFSTYDQTEATQIGSSYFDDSAIPPVSFGKREGSIETSRLQQCIDENIIN